MYRKALKAKDAQLGGELAIVFPDVRQILAQTWSFLFAVYICDRNGNSIYSHQNDFRLSSKTTSYVRLLKIKNPLIDRHGYDDCFLLCQKKVIHVYVCDPVIKYHAVFLLISERVKNTKLSETTTMAKFYELGYGYFNLGI